MASTTNKAQDAPTRATRVADNARSRRVRALEAAAVGAGAVALATIGTVLDPFIGLALIAILVILLAIALRVPATFFAFAGVLSVLVSTAIPMILPTGPSVSILLRLLGIACLVAGGLAHSSAVPSRWPMRPHSSFICAVGMAMALYVTVATLIHGEPLAFVSYLLGLAAMCLCLVAASTWLPSDSLRIGLISSLAVVVIGSLICGIVAPSIAIEQGRLRGFAENANGLGCFAFILGALAVTIVRQRLWSIGMFTASALAILWSGSRNSALALLVVVVLVGLLAAPWPAKTATLLVAGSCVVVYLLNPIYVTSLLGRLATISNTREVTFAYAVSVFNRNPFTGVGLGHELVQVASSPMRAIAHAGIWGGIAVTVMWLSIAIYGQTAGVRGMAVALGIVTFSVFEGVLLSPMGPFLLVLLCSLIVVQREGDDKSATHWRRRRMHYVVESRPVKPKFPAIHD